MTGYNDDFFRDYAYTKKGNINIFLWRSMLEDYYLTQLVHFYDEYFDDEFDVFMGLLKDARNEAVQMLIRVFKDVGYSEEVAVALGNALQQKMAQNEAYGLEDRDLLQITFTANGNLVLFHFPYPGDNEEEEEDEE